METKIVKGDAYTLAKKLEVLLNDSWEIKSFFKSSGTVGCFLTKSSS